MRFDGYRARECCGEEMGRERVWVNHEGYCTAHTCQQCGRRAVFYDNGAVSIDTNYCCQRCGSYLISAFSPHMPAHYVCSGETGIQCSWIDPKIRRVAEA